LFSVLAFSQESQSVNQAIPTISTNSVNNSSPNGTDISTILLGKLQTLKTLNESQVTQAEKLKENSQTTSQALNNENVIDNQESTQSSQALDNIAQTQATSSQASNQAVISSTNASNSLQQVSNIDNKIDIITDKEINSLKAEVRKWKEIGIGSAIVSGLFAGYLGGHAVHFW
jgi:hypothetical protein